MFRVQSNVDIGWGLRASGVLNARVAARTCGWRRSSVRPPARRSRSRPTTATASECRAQTIIDLGLQKTFKLGSDVALDIGLQLLNVLNEDAEEYYSTWTLFQGQDFNPSSWVSPRRLQVKVQLAF